jgi:hypothetical protein
MTDQLNWFKSSYSGSQGGACVEVAFDWNTSSYSGDQGGHCVEIATCPHAVHVRDSKDTARPGLAVAPEAWGAFLRTVR